MIDAFREGGVITFTGKCNAILPQRMNFDTFGGVRDGRKVFPTFKRVDCRVKLVFAFNFEHVSVSKFVEMFV